MNDALGARFVDFGGWEMPVQYDSVLAEHRAVRTRAGFFDVSHLGRFSIKGQGAAGVLERLLTNDVSSLLPGRTQYNLLLNDAGGIEDDLLVWRWDETTFWVMPNAATHDAVLAIFTEVAADAVLTDLRNNSAMVAVQGPEAPQLLEQRLGSWPKRFATARIGDLSVAGTGYTGERGGEIVGPPEVIQKLVEDLIGMGVTPCGLGARDTLRLEAGLLLAGQDFDRDTTPYEAGLQGAISWNHDFVGRSALESMRAPEKALVPFKTEGRKIPRHGYALRSGPSKGLVTSGNFSPMLECGIGFGYLSPESETLEVEIRGKWEPAERSTVPFYRR